MVQGPMLSVGLVTGKRGGYRWQEATPGGKYLQGVDSPIPFPGHFPMFYVPMYCSPTHPSVVSLPSLTSLPFQPFLFLRTHPLPS